MPSVVYGIVSSISGLSIFYLPETLGESLPDTIQLAEMMAARQKARKRTLKRLKMSKYSLPLSSFYQLSPLKVQVNYNEFPQC